MIINKLSQYLQKLEDTASRIEITKILSDLYKNSSADEIDKVVYLSLGILAPSFRGIVFNIAEQMMIRSLAKAYESEIDKVKKLYKEKGDLGAVAFDLAQNSKSAGNLTVNKLYEELVNIAKDSGEESQERKVTQMASLLNKLDPLSAKYVTRIPLGNLRLGFSDLTILDALSWMETGGKSQKAKLQRAYEVMPDIGVLAQKVKEAGIEKATKNPKPVLGIPVAPMLAQRLNTPEEMIKKMTTVAVEPKFDGLRVGIHFKKGKLVKAFTRNLHDISLMFPELEKMGKHLNASEVILDSEAVGLDEKTLSVLDFQSTMTRRRKHDIADFVSKIPIKFCVFDILYKDGTSLMGEPYTKRREILNKTIKKNPLLNVVEYSLTDNPSVIDKYYDLQINEGLEGIIIKKSDSDYVPGRTGWRWVKMKQKVTSAGKLTDTVDAVVMGYTVGKGKRVTFGLGQFLVGVKDGDSIKTITKVGTGLSDEQFKNLKTRLEKIMTPTQPKEYEVNKVLLPDYWVKPELVVEIAADDITKSPNHTAGLALRFPRLVKIRDDKSVSNATTLSELKKIYENQKNIH
jgi:DNA ligase-1